METLDLDSLDVVHAGRNTFPLGARVRALAAEAVMDQVRALR
jgi:hypothetical protein